MIRLLQKHQIGQEIRPDGPQSHYAKKGTPSMGGLLIIVSTLVPTLVWGNLGNIYVWVAVLSMVLFGLIGLWTTSSSSAGNSPSGCASGRRSPSSSSWPPASGWSSSGWGRTGGSA
jgi:phospho-N-acetylmuramoyl-pentapeptide-transferase